MLLARVGEAGMRQIRPGGDARRALVGIGIRRGRGQRIVPGGRRRDRLRPTHTQIVEAHARSDDQHAFVAQRGERAPGGDMDGGIEIAAQRQLRERNVGVRQRDLHRDEDAMVPAARRLLARGEARAAQQVGGGAGDIGRAGRIPAQLVSMGRKAVIVEQQGRPIADMDGEVRRLPMARHQQDRAWPGRQIGDQPAEIILHRLPHRIALDAIGIGRVHEETGAAAMRDEQAGLAQGGVGIGNGIGGHGRHIGNARSSRNGKRRNRAFRRRRLRCRD